MKKTIKILAEKMIALQETNDGTLEGGFASIKGGFRSLDQSGTNQFVCTNSNDCTQSTNTTACTNSGTCIA